MGDNGRTVQVFRWTASTSQTRTLTQPDTEVTPRPCVSFCHPLSPPSLTHHYPALLFGSSFNPAWWSLKSLDLG